MVLRYIGMPVQLFIIAVFMLFIITGCTELEGTNDNGRKETGDAESSPPVSEKVDESIIDEIVELKKTEGTWKVEKKLKKMAEEDPEKARTIAQIVEERFEQERGVVTTEVPDEIKQKDKRFLQEYGWTTSGLINSFKISLPDNFIHEPGEFPEAIYWAYNNELNKDIGKDLKPYLGEQVIVNLYDVKESLPEFMRPREDSGRAIVVRYQEDIIGSWMGAGRHDAFACSLKGNSREEITGKKWSKWVQKVIDPEHSQERKLAELNAEEVVKQYWNAADAGDQEKAYSLLSRCNIRSFLFSNMDNELIYNQRFQDATIGGLANIKSVELLDIEEQEPRESQHDLRDKKRFRVTLDKEVRSTITHGGGEQSRFMTLVKETPETGWRIKGIGTGP